MNNKPYIVLFLFLMAIGFMSCKKDEDPNIQSITFEREYFQYTPTTVTVSGVYSYDGRIDGIKMQVGQRNDLADARAFEADIDGTNYTVELQVFNLERNTTTATRWTTDSRNPTRPKPRPSPHLPTPRW